MDLDLRKYVIDPTMHFLGAKPAIKILVITEVDPRVAYFIKPFLAVANHPTYRGVMGE
jgi:hypothetical protein